MAEAMKIRARMQGELAEIRVLMTHPMDTGLSKDSNGKLIPAHYIQSIRVDVAGKRVIDGQTATSISRNPVFGFKVKGVRAGDPVVIQWIDNRGEERRDETTIAA